MGTIHNQLTTGTNMQTYEQTELNRHLSELRAIESARFTHESRMTFDNRKDAEAYLKNEKAIMRDLNPALYALCTYTIEENQD